MRMLSSYQGLILETLFFPISVIISITPTSLSPRSLFGVPPGWSNQGKSSQPNRTGCLESIAQIACTIVVNCLRKINVISSHLLLFVIQGGSVDTLLDLLITARCIRKSGKP